MPDGAPVGAVDLHTHFMPAGLEDVGSRTGDPRWPRLVVGTDGMGAVMRGEELYRKVQAPFWDVGARLDAMDRAGVAVQVLSPIPVALTYWADIPTATSFAQSYNDGLAATVEDAPDRFCALGTVPLQDPAAAIAELRRLLDLGLHGVEIGSVVGHLELAAPELRRFFRAADELGVPLFLHPTDRSVCGDRCRGGLDEFGIAMLTDSSIAVSNLVFGGVLDECADLRVCVAHGGGSFPWVYPRLLEYAKARMDMKAGHADELVRRLFVDVLVFDQEHLPLLMHRFGAEHLVFGSDYPFLAPDLAPDGLLREAEDRGILRGAEVQAISRANALAFLGLAEAGRR